ncbi:hypothetical protein [Burkholderia gladioli]|uniref:hypothetical protein n=1 Tax=Burkholderia gladioli TaxID=28095 RepID=UPI00164043D3|nr:hypothetical protein [Burkholderia gladioli]
MKGTVSRRAVPMLMALALALVTGRSFAQQNESSPDSAVQIVTLYSVSRPGSELQAAGKAQQPPIRIVNGGVKSAGDSCWKLSDTGQITSMPGDCYVLRSAEDGERPPSQ